MEDPVPTYNRYRLGVSVIVNSVAHILLLKTIVSPHGICSEGRTRIGVNNFRPTLTLISPKCCFARIEGACAVDVDGDKTFNPLSLKIYVTCSGYHTSCRKGQGVHTKIFFGIKSTPA